MLQHSVMLVCLLSFFVGSQVLARTIDSRIRIDVKSNLGNCSEAAVGCGRLYGKIFTATVQPIEDSCSQVSADCGAGLCRHKLDMKMVDDIKLSLNPSFDYVDGIVTARITGSFTFSHSKTSDTTCEWPGTYDDVRFVAKEAWLASRCTEAVTEICEL